MFTPRGRPTGLKRQVGTATARGGEGERRTDLGGHTLRTTCPRGLARLCNLELMPRRSVLRRAADRNGDSSSSCRREAASARSGRVLCVEGSKESCKLADCGTGELQRAGRPAAWSSAVSLQPADGPRILSPECTKPRRSLRRTVKYSAVQQHCSTALISS